MQLDVDIEPTFRHRQTERHHHGTAYPTLNPDRQKVTHKTGLGRLIGLIGLLRLIGLIMD